MKTKVYYAITWEAIDLVSRLGIMREHLTMMYMKDSKNKGKRDEDCCCDLDYSYKIVD